jgi:ankyrin repeat protein
MKGASNMMNNLQFMIDLLKSECAVQADYDREVKVVREMKNGHGIQYVNHIVAGVVLGSAESIENNIFEIDAYMCGEKESFRKLLERMAVGGLKDSEERELGKRVLGAACSGGRFEIVQELIQQWIGKCVQEDDKEEEEKVEEKQHVDLQEGVVSTNHVHINHHPYDMTSNNNLTYDSRVLWVADLINESLVVWSASSGGHAKVVQLLLNVSPAAVDVNVANHDGSTALYQACSSGHGTVVRTLLTRGELNVNASSETGCTPLYIASQKGYVEIVRLLLSSSSSVVKIDVNIPKNSGETPLYTACERGHVDVVHMLLELGHDMDVNQSEQEDGCTPLFMAAQEGYAEIVRLLLSSNHIDVNQCTTAQHVTPLYMACMEGHVEIVRLLLFRNDIDANTPTNTNGGQKSPLHISCANDHVAIVQLLLERQDIKHSLNATDEDGCTALWTACEKGHVGIVRLLLSTLNDAVEVNTAEKDGATCLYVACQEGHVEVVKQLLLKKKINVNLAVMNGDEKDCTPLIVACYIGQASVVEQLLLSNSLDCSTLFEGKSALEWAQPNVRSIGLEFLDEDVDEEGRVRVVELFSGVC